MKHRSILRMLTAGVLCCTLCCTGLTVPAVSAEETGELPARFDWRDANPPVLTPVKKQIGGTCWAYSTIACAESDLIRKGMADISIDLSESHLIWFTQGQDSPTDPDDPRYGGGLAVGVKAYDSGYGKYPSTIASLAAWQGVVNETDAPAHSEKQEIEESLRYASIAHLQNAESYDASDIQNIKNQLMDKGPLLMRYFSRTSPPLSEQSGYYNPDFSLEHNETPGGYHSVAVVGWDDRFPKEDFNHEAPADGAWIIRNSYGESQKNSDNGYFYMSYYEPSVQEVRSYDFEPVTNYGAVYHYNCSNIYTRLIASSDDMGFVIANVFEAKKPEKVEAVGFFTDTPSEPYEISVYALEPGFADPQDGTLIETISGVAEYKGFHTVKLPHSYAVDQGQMYSAVVKTAPKKDDSFYMDYHCYKKGVSYCAYYSVQNGEKPVWSDCYDKGYGDVCIHVYTEYEGETEDYIRGDLNRDGAVSTVDLSLVKQVLLGSARTDICLPAADWNGDNAMNAEDARGLLSFLLGIPEQGELKIRLTGSTADKRDEVFRRQMQDAVAARVPDIDFTQFTFETHGMTYLHDKNDATEEIGKQFYFWVYYQDYLLDSEHYEIRIQQYYDGTYETDADFLTADVQEKLAKAIAAPRIAEADAVRAAKAYAVSLTLPDLPSVLYQPSERFGENTKLVVYSLEEGRLAYQVSDPQFNGYETGTGQSAVLCEAAANVYVDAVTGEVLENRFLTVKSVS